MSGLAIDVIDPIVPLRREDRAVSRIAFRKNCQPQRAAIFDFGNSSSILASAAAMDHPR